MFEQARLIGSNPGSPPDAVLVDAIAAGDPAAFRTLMRRYNRRLYRIARSIVRDDFEAEDVLQNAYLLVFRGIRKFRGESGLSTWLCRIVINEALAFLRRRSRSAHVINLDGDELEAAIESEASPLADRSERPDEALMRADMRTLIQDKIDQLPLAYRTVFMLRALEELSVTEAAAVLHIPEATVRSRFFRARARLRASLSSCDKRALGAAFPFAEAHCAGMVVRVMATVSVCLTSLELFG